MEYAISRSINGISLNGQEFLLTSNGDIMTFASETLAISFAGKICTGQHNTDIDLQEYGIHIVPLNRSLK